MPNAGRTSSFVGAPPTVLVLHGDRRRVVSWVERGTVPCYVFPLEGASCAVVPAGPGHAAGPYTDPSLMLVSRPTPMLLRPSLAFLADGSRSVCVVQARRWRALPRWFVVQQGVGPVRAELPQADTTDLLEVAPNPHPEALSRVLDQVDAHPVDFLRGLMAALGLDAGHLLDLPHISGIEADVIEPDRAAVRRFDKHVRDEREERQEIEERHL